MKKSQVNEQEDQLEEATLKVTADFIKYATDQLEITLWGGIDIKHGKLASGHAAHTTYR